MCSILFVRLIFKIYFTTCVVHVQKINFEKQFITDVDSQLKEKEIIFLNYVYITDANFSFNLNTKYLNILRMYIIINNTYYVGWFNIIYYKTQSIKELINETKYSFFLVFCRFFFLAFPRVWRVKFVICSRDD